jgi:hypothetical protein
VLDVVGERGLELAIGMDGAPRVSGPSTEITDGLRLALKANRKEILAYLKSQGAEQPKECLWKTGHISPHWFSGSAWPVGAFWWRYVGETEWRGIPGTPGESEK